MALAPTELLNLAVIGEHTSPSLCFSLAGSASACLAPPRRSSPLLPLALADAQWATGCRSQESSAKKPVLERGLHAQDGFVGMLGLHLYGPLEPQSVNDRSSEVNPRRTIADGQSSTHYRKFSTVYRCRPVATEPSSIVSRQ